MKENAAITAAPYVQIAPRLNNDRPDQHTAFASSPSTNASIDDKKKKLLPPLQSLQSMIKLNNKNRSAAMEAAAAKETEQALLTLPPILPKPVSMSGVEGIGCRMAGIHAKNNANGGGSKPTRKRSRGSKRSSACSGMPASMLELMSSTGDTASLLHPSSLDNNGVMATDLGMLRQLDKAEYRRQVHLRCEHRRRDAIADGMQSLRDAIGRTRSTYFASLRAKDAARRSVNRAGNAVDAESLSKMALVKEAIAAISTMRKMHAQLVVEQNRLAELNGVSAIPESTKSGD